MLAFISNNFRFDLTHLKVTFNELNPWFQSDLSGEFSFPFDMPAADWAKLYDFKNYNAKNISREFSGQLYRDGEMIKATLKIHEVQGDTVSCVVYSGVDVLSLLDISLTDLPLHDFTVSNLKMHAKTIITQSYPAVDYNFPMVHTDKYDPESSEFNNFEKVLNKFVGGDFVENQLEEESNTDQIRNIMQPMPYLMYVVHRLFLAAGLELEGDILNDPDLRKAILFRDGSYYVSLAKEAINIAIGVDEAQSETSINDIIHSFYQKQIVIERKGDYALSGSFYNFIYLQWNVLDASSVLCTIQKNAEVIYTFEREAQDGAEPTDLHFLTLQSLDFELSLNAGDVLTFSKLELKRDQVPSVTPDYPEAASFNLYPVRYREDNGDPILSLLDLDAIQLNRCVPDMSGKDLINTLRIWKNFSFVPNGRKIRMDYVEPRLNRSAAVDLRAHDVEEPLRTFSEERSFELAFTDGSNSVYSYDKMFVSSAGAILNTYTKKAETTPINIDGLPYPVVERSGINTAYAFDDESGKLRLLFFRAVPEGTPPVSYNNTGMLIPAVYNSHYKNWLDFRVNSVTYQWNFTIPVEKLRDIAIQSLIYAYNNYHVFTELEKERISILRYRVTAKSESLQ